MRKFSTILLFVILSSVSLTVRAQAPQIPPGFSLPQELGTLELSDYTDYGKRRYGDAFTYSAVWTVDYAPSAKWSQMSKEQKKQFEILRNLTMQALKTGVTAAGGSIEFKAPSKDGVSAEQYSQMYGKGRMEGEWRITHPNDNYLVLWWVKLQSGYEKSSLMGGDYEYPYISVYISHTQMK